MRLHDWQQKALDHAMQSTRTRVLIAAPTGSGKSYVQLALRDAIPDSWLVTPRIEIIKGLLEKLSPCLNLSLLSDTSIIEVSERARITTPIRLKNRMLNGTFDQPISTVIWDEVHHHTADSWTMLDAISGATRHVGFTATPFRGTPKGTAEFRAVWGEPFRPLTYPQAVQEKLIRFPELRTVPLVDDDIVKVVNGEFQIESLESETVTRLDDFCRYVRRDDGVSSMVSLPSVRLIEALGEKFNNLSIPFDVVTGITSYATRQRAFKRCLECEAVLLQINVVSEGVDLPIERLYDLSPTLSPVKWLQQLGRIMRPTTPHQPEYYCFNRNLLRHAYLLDGLVPVAKIVEAQAAFPTGTFRSLGARAIGLEALGRFKPAEIVAANGLNIVLYTMSTIVGTDMIQYAIVLHPAMTEPLIATKRNIKEGNTIQWGKWTRHDAPLTDLKGFKSSSPTGITSKQAQWWERAASRFGLNNAMIPNAKQFQLLPILSDLNLKIT